MITEAKAERYAIENAQAEIEASCVDGCPACVHIGMCTDRSEQKQIVSLKIAEKIMMYFRKNVFQEELDNMNDRRGLDGLEPVGLLKINTDRETFDVVCF
jgi:hypothetical protein